MNDCYETKGITRILIRLPEEEKEKLITWNLFKVFPFSFSIHILSRLVLARLGSSCLVLSCLPFNNLHNYFIFIVLQLDPPFSFHHVEEFMYIFCWINERISVPIATIRRGMCITLKCEGKFVTINNWYNFHKMQIKWNISNNSEGSERNKNHVQLCTLCFFENVKHHRAINLHKGIFSLQKIEHFYINSTTSNYTASNRIEIFQSSFPWNGNALQCNGDFPIFLNKPIRHCDSHVFL